MPLRVPLRVSLSCHIAPYSPLHAVTPCLPYHRADHAAVLIVSLRHRSPPTIAPPCLSDCGEGNGEGDNQIAAVAQHRTRTERDVPLLCIAALPTYLTTGCDIVFIVEREIRNPQVRKDFTNG